MVITWLFLVEILCAYHIKIPRNQSAFALDLGLEWINPTKSTQYFSLLSRENWRKSWGPEGLASQRQQSRLWHKHQLTDNRKHPLTTCVTMMMILSSWYFTSYGVQRKLKNTNVATIVLYPLQKAIVLFSVSGFSAAWVAGWADSNKQEGLLPQDMFVPSYTTGCPKKNVLLFGRAVAPSFLGLFSNVRGVSECSWPQLSDEYWNFVITSQEAWEKWV